jgi:uncharacterized protein
MVAHEFIVSSRDLDASGKRFRFVVRASWIRGALEDTDVQPSGSDGELDVRLSKSGRDVVVRGVLTAELCVACARCLKPAGIPVRESLSALVVPAGSLSKDSAEDDAEDSSASEPTLDEADLIPYDGESVVLDQLVRDELLLSIPMIPLCSESCPGISPQTPPEPSAPGIDPRFRPLLRLKKSLT